MNNQIAKCGTAAGPGHHRPITFYQLLAPTGEQIGLDHARISEVSATAMEIEAIANEVHDRMRGAREYNWTFEDEDNWVRENAAKIAQTMGYRINRVLR
jgi:hypothetical protein